MLAAVMTDSAVDGVHIRYYTFKMLNIVSQKKTLDFFIMTLANMYRSAKHVQRVTNLSQCEIPQTFPATLHGIPTPVMLPSLCRCSAGFAESWLGGGVSAPLPPEAKII